MRVKITKTVHLNDLAGETRRMLDGIKNKIVYALPDQVSQIVKMSLSNSAEEYFQTIEFIDSFRKELSAIDESLQEVENIMQGYKEAITPSTEEQVADNEQDEYEEFMHQVLDAGEDLDEEG